MTYNLLTGFSVCRMVQRIVLIANFQIGTFGTEVLTVLQVVS